MFKKLFIVLSGLLFLGCEKDDICSDADANTSRLVIDFYDISNISEKKTVSNLLIVGDVNGEASDYGNAETRDQISIPLKITEESTTFSLISDYTIDTNGTPDDDSDDIVTGNEDIVTINYENEEIYISRACGFKNIFNNTMINVTNDSDNWILNTDVINAKIENEQDAHIYIYH